MSSKKHIHFIGICGVAMSALAIAFKRQGYHVTGSDVGFYPPISTHLTENDIAYYPGWHPEKMTADGTPDIVVVGNVASSTNPEWIFVQKNKIPYKSYPEVVAEFFIKQNSIVCAGTYGKSTSSALMTWILKQADYNPSYMFGGLSNDIPYSAENTPSEWSVVEGDEYKASRWDTGPKFAYYKPTHLLLTSVVWDHADIYPTETKYVDAFTKLLAGISKTSVRVISEQAENALDIPKNTCITYGLSKDATYRYSDILQTTNGLTFTIHHGTTKTVITSPCFGDYMVDNITGCFALAHTLGIEIATITKAITTFTGMRRRLEKRATAPLVIFDDIAHSPAKAKSVLATLRALYNTSIIAVFEPNTGNRRPQAIPWYDHAFTDADEVIIPRLTRVKHNPNEEPPLEGNELAEVIAGTHENVSYQDNDEALLAYLQKKPLGSVVVFLGSHGFRGMIEKLISK